MPLDKMAPLIFQATNYIQLAFTRDNISKRGNE